MELHMEWQSKHSREQTGSFFTHVICLQKKKGKRKKLHGDLKSYFYVQRERRGDETCRCVQ